MMQPIPSFGAGRGHRGWGLVLCGTLGFAWLAVACGAKTERVLSKIPAVVQNASGGGGANGSGGAAADSGGSANGGSAVTGGSPSDGGSIATGGSQAPTTGGAAGAQSTLLLNASGTPIGFAALGSGGTTGGGQRLADIPANCDELQSLLKDAVARVILINAAIDCTLLSPTQVQTCELGCDSTTGDTKTIHRMMDSSTTACSVGGATSTTPVSETTNAIQINVNSNKTLLGTGPGAIISGATLYIGPSVSNVIIQNLTLTKVNPDLTEAGDAITIAGAHHVWVDHCQFSLISDGFIDMPEPASSPTAVTASNVTVSWNHFDGLNPASCAGQHNYANTIENAQVTFHHNYWDSTLSTSPKITKAYALVHLFNNYWFNVLYYSIGIDKGAQALIEYNDFDTSFRPYWGLNQCIDKANCAIGDSSGSNQFEPAPADTAQNKDTGGTLVGLPAYTLTSMQLEPASNVKDDVTQNAGPKLTIP